MSTPSLNRAGMQTKKIIARKILCLGEYVLGYNFHPRSSQGYGQKVSTLQIATTSQIITGFNFFEIAFPKMPISINSFGLSVW